MLYQTPKEYREVFKESLPQADILKIANLTESIALEKKGGLAEIGTYFGIHTDKELTSLFDDLRNILRDHSAKAFEIAHLLENPAHRIAFKYAEKKGWCVVDPNSLTHEFIHRKNFITHLKKVFPSNDIPDLDIIRSYLAIELKALTTRQNPQLEKLRDEFRKLSVKHLVIDKTTAYRTDTESLVHLATIHNRPDILHRLAQCGVDLNKPNDIKTRPIAHAIEFNHPDCVRLLMKYNVQHTKILEDDPRYTTFFLSVKYGREEIVEILLKNQQALETANFYKLLKESIKGYSHKIFQNLTEHLLNDPEQVKRADFQDLSTALIEHEGKEKMLQIFLDQSEILPRIDIGAVWDDALDFGNPKVITALLNQTNVMAQVDFQNLLKKAIDYAVNYDNRLGGLQSFIDHAVTNSQKIGKIDFTPLRTEAENDPDVKQILDQFEKDYALKAKANLLIRKTPDSYKTSSVSNPKWEGMMKSMIEKKAQTPTFSTTNDTQAANDESNQLEQDDHEARSSRRFLR